MKKLLIFVVLLCYLFDTNRAEKGFIASFQSSGKWSPNESIEYTGNISTLIEFTACHWEKMHYFSGDINTVWSYCVYIRKDDSKMKCIEMYYTISSDIGAYIDVMIDYWKDEWTDETLYSVFKNVPYKHRAWNHFCWSYSSITGNNILYHNGKPTGVVNLIDEHAISKSATLIMQGYYYTLHLI